MFEAVINKGGERVLSQELTASEKKRRVVLKRVNLDGSGVRTNFLQGGTMARVRLLLASVIPAVPSVLLLSCSSQETLIGSPHLAFADLFDWTGFGCLCDASASRSMC